MKNILRNFWLTLTRFKTASILNILGLTVAITVFTVIMIQTYWELTYNKGIKQHEQIFRMVRKDPGYSSSVQNRPLGETVGKSSPSVDSYTCVSHCMEEMMKTVSNNGQEKEVKTHLTKSSPSITELLSLECMDGDFQRFNEPNAAIIPKSLANLLFSDEDPIGNLIFSSKNDTLSVVAVYKDLPNNCTFKNGIYSNIGDYFITRKSDYSFVYYYKLNSPNAKGDVEMQAKRIDYEMQERDEDDDEEDEIRSFILEPFSNLYYSEVMSNFNTGNRLLTNLLTSIAIVILLIAIINYINFFMALVPIRIRNININKVFGTPTSALRLNIVGEAVGLLLLAFGLALLLVQYLSGTFISDLIVTSLIIADNLFIVTMIGILIVVIGILAGLFPAFYITKFNPALILKGSFGRSKQGQVFRNVLVVFQFTMSCILIICASFVYLQNRYMQKYDYGFNRDRLITVDVGKTIASQPQTFLDELRKNTDIENIAFASNPMVGMQNGWGRSYNGEQIFFNYLPVSWNYPEFMDIKLIEGRFFNEEDDSKIGGTIIFNETAAKKYNIKVGDFFSCHSSEKAEIVGIVKDFNFSSLQNSIEPYALYNFGSKGWFIPSLAHIRLSPGADFKQISEYLTFVIQKLDPTIEPEKISITPFDENIESLYTKEINLTKIISLFSLVAILISLMGVFGIVVFENQHRKKEIALRKIHGSTAILILGMFNRKFITILAISAVIAVPAAYFAVTQWLSGFEYRTPMFWWVFVAGILVVAFITLLTVTLQTYRNANENPVRALKTE